MGAPVHEDEAPQPNVTRRIDMGPEGGAWSYLGSLASKNARSLMRFFSSREKEGAS